MLSNTELNRKARIYWIKGDISLTESQISTNYLIEYRIRDPPIQPLI